MPEEILRQKLMSKALKCECHRDTLYELRGNQYKSRKEIIDDIIANDNGGIMAEEEFETSPMKLLLDKIREKEGT